jgi:hypothetical protein
MQKVIGLAVILLAACASPQDPTGGIRASGARVGLQASGVLGFQATPAGIAAFDSGIRLLNKGGTE